MHHHTESERSVGEPYAVRNAESLEVERERSTCIRFRRLS